MFLVRNVFRAKPGKAKDLVAKFKAGQPHYEKLSSGKMRCMTDAVAGFWTVIVESEVEDLGSFMKAVDKAGSDAKLREAMAGYMDLVEGGHREIFKIE